MKKRDWFLSLLLVAATLLAYLPAWRGTPIWDDNVHLIRPALQSWHGLWVIWTQPGSMDQYYPLSYAALWAGNKIWGQAPLGYHLLNILLHAGSALLLLRILRKLNVPGGWLAAFIFALHPVHVESVAWISEIKNTLSCALLFGSALIYLDFDKSRTRRHYAAALVLFAMGLMAKSVIATMPAALLVVFWWQRGNLSWRKDVLSLVPFFIVGIASGLFTAWAEKKISGAEGEAFNISMMERLLIAGRAFWFYLGKLFWPVDIGLVYARWEISPSAWWQYLFPVAALLLVACLWMLRKRHRGPLATVLLFAGMAFPALGFVDINYFIYSFVADHFQYPASAVVIVFVAACASLLLDSMGGWQRMAGWGLCVAMLAMFAVMTWYESFKYTDAETSYRAMIAKNPACWIAYTNLGDILAGQGKLDDALACEMKALQLSAGHAKVENSMGSLLLQQTRASNQRDEDSSQTRDEKVNAAIGHFEKAIAVKPRYAEAHNNLGNAYLMKRRTTEAAAQYQKAIEISPDYAQAHENYALLLMGKGDTAGAIDHYRKALAIAPNHVEAINNLGVAYFQQSRTDDAIAQYEQALRQRPDYAEAQNNLGVALLKKGNAKEAITHFEKALESVPGHPRALNYLAWVLATCPDASLRNGTRAVDLSKRLNGITGGRNAQALMTLAAAYAECGRFVEANTTVEEALQLARNQNNTGMVSTLTAQAALYQSRKPYREIPGR